MSDVPYVRSDEPFTSLEFVDPVDLDTVELRARWAPWIDLAESDRTPLRVRHALFLARTLTGGEALPVPHWFGMVSVTSARTQVVRQMRADEYLCDRPSGLGDELRTVAWTELVYRLEGWAEQDPTSRVTLVTLLGQLGFHKYVARLVPGLSLTATDPLTQQFAYETGRAIHQINRTAPMPLRLFEYLANHAHSPMLRLVAALQHVSAQSRDYRDRVTAGSWLARAAELATALDGEPGWCANLGHSRFHRAAALYHVLDKDVDMAAEQMRLALRYDDAMLDQVDGGADGGAVLHYARENRRLVLEGFVKLDALAGTFHAPAGAVERLLELDPFDPDPLHSAASYHERRGAVEEACALYLRAARSGSIRGAGAAFAAGRCLERLGRPSDAECAYRLCLELDPAAVTPRERLRELGSNRRSTAVG